MCHAIDKMNSVCECIYKSVYMCVVFLLLILLSLLRFNHVQLINGLTVPQIMLLCMFA